MLEMCVVKMEDLGLDEEDSQDSVEVMQMEDRDKEIEDIPNK